MTGGTSEPGFGLRERKKQQMRQQLADVALRLFAERGFDGTTVEDIANACDVSPRTFFRYFPTKEDVLFAGKEDASAGLVRAIDERPAGESPFEALRNAYLAYAAELEGQRERILLRRSVLAAVPTLLTRDVERHVAWENELTDALHRRAGGLGDPSMACRLVAAAGTAAFRAAVQCWMADASTDLRSLLVDAFDQLARGLDAPAAVH